MVGARPRKAAPDRRHAAAVLIGAVMGIPATAWTVAVPVLAITPIVLSLQSDAPSQG